MAWASACGRCPESEHDMAKAKTLFINRELSWLEFNQRVLEEAMNDAVPALERLKFLAITGSNLDEFFMVRVGSLQMQRDQGVRRLVALRGDLPSGAGGGLGEFRYAAELVALIRERFGDHFSIEVAAYPEFHPQAQNAEKDLEHFRQKVEAGADSAITQYFYNADAYAAFLDRVRAMGVTIPIIPGIMPVTNYTQLARFSDACGAEIPRFMRKRLEAYGDDTASIRAFGVDVVSRLCERLLDNGAPGLHFYSMNQAAPSEAIWNNLGIGNRG